MAKKTESIKWTFAEVARGQGVTAYALAVQLAGRVARPTVYAYFSRPPVRPDLRTVHALLLGLKELTGKTYKLSDVLEVTP